VTIAVVRVRFPSRAHNESLDYQEIVEQKRHMIVSATPQVTLKTESFMSNYEPRFVTPLPNSKDQRVYIKYKVWDQDKGKFVWAKDYDVNKEPEAKRQRFAKERIKLIKSHLAKGLVKSKSTIRAVEEITRIKEAKQSLTITQAIDIGMDEKRRMNLRQISNYEHRSAIFKRWLKNTNYDRLPAELFKVEQIKSFVHHLRSKRSCSPRTINNYLNDLSTLLNVSIENEILDHNHFTKIKKERTGIGKNWGYTPDQQLELLNYIKNEKPMYLMLVQFMYYTLARPKELSHLKVGDIGKRYPNQIWFGEEVTKEFMERNVFIPEALQKVILENKLHLMPKDWYVFSIDFKPGKERLHSRNWGQRFRDNVLNSFGEKYSSNYTLYSWKHTGVISLIMAGVTPAAVQRQAGHRSPYSFQKYLKTLGLFPNDEILNDFPLLPE
jgi:integrase